MIIALNIIDNTGKYLLLLMNAPGLRLLSSAGQASVLPLHMHTLSLLKAEL